MKCVACNTRNIPLADGYLVRNGFREHSLVKRYDFYCKDCKKDPAVKPGQGTAVEGSQPLGEELEEYENLTGDASPDC